MLGIVKQYIRDHFDLVNILSHIARHSNCTVISVMANDAGIAGKVNKMLGRYKENYKHLCIWLRPVRFSISRRFYLYRETICGWNNVVFK